MLGRRVGGRWCRLPGPTVEVRICGLLGLFRPTPRLAASREPGETRDVPRVSSGITNRCGKVDSLDRALEVGRRIEAGDFSHVPPRRPNDPGYPTVEAEVVVKDRQKLLSLSVHPCGDSFTLASQLAQDLGYVVRDERFEILLPAGREARCLVISGTRACGSPTASISF